MAVAMLAALAVKAAQKIKEWVNAAVEFTKEGIRPASVAEGVTAAFNRLNKPDLLKNMRAETKGLPTDFQLMQTAVRANNFSIPLENLGKLLKFAQQRAQETGESVDYLANSIITGLGRKSPLILDNLGISAAKLQERVKATGDFSKAAIAIVNEEPEKQGDSALTAADSATQASVKWQNAQTKLGAQLPGISNLWNTFSGAVAERTGALIEKYLPGIIKGLEYIINEFVDLYNKSLLIRIQMTVTTAVFRTFFSILKSGFNTTIASLKLIWQNLKAVITLDFSGLKTAFDDFNRSILENARKSKDSFPDIWSSLPEQVNGKLKKVTLSASPAGTGSGQPAGDAAKSGCGKSKTNSRTKSTC